MASEKYKAGIAQGAALSRSTGLRAWPPFVTSLGARRSAQPFARCGSCPPKRHLSSAGTWVRYGDTPLCFRCARELAEGLGERSE